MKRWCQENEPGDIERVPVVERHLGSERPAHNPRRRQSLGANEIDSRFEIETLVDSLPEDSL